MQEIEYTRNFIVLDTETTGLSPQTDELLQLSILDFHGAVLFNSYFRPQRTSNWPDAQKVNGIAPEIVKDSPSLLDKLPHIQKIISKAECIVGYNVAFDISFLQASGISFDHLIDQNNGWHAVDLMELFAAINGEWNDYYGHFTWKSLSVAAHYYGYDWGQDSAHDSLSDCKATFHIWQEMIRTGDVVRAENLIRAAMSET